jgi:hypothetical protein
MEPSEPDRAATESRRAENPFGWLPTDELLERTQIRSGAIRHRTELFVKNGRWYLIEPTAGISKIGWGDLSFGNLETLAAALGPNQVFVVLPEAPPGGQHLPIDDHTSGGEWCWYDRPDHSGGLNVAQLCDAAWYALMESDVRYVDDRGEANRLGYVWKRRGYRYTHTGRIISTGKVRVRAIRPDELAAVVGRSLGLPGTDVLSDHSEPI